MLLTLVNPRMKEYDLFAAMVGCSAVLSIRPNKRWLLVFVGFSLAALPTIGRFFSLSYRWQWDRWMIFGLALLGFDFILATQRHADGLIPPRERRAQS